MAAAPGKYPHLTAGSQRKPGQHVLPWHALAFQPRAQSQGTLGTGHAVTPAPQSPPACRAASPCPLQGQWTMTQAAPIPSPRALPKGLTRGFGGLWEKAGPGHHPQKRSGRPSLQEACLALRLGPHPQLMAQPRPHMPMTMVTSTHSSRWAPAHPLCTEVLLGAWLSRHPALLRPQVRAGVQGRGPMGLSGYPTHRLAGGVRPHHQHRGHRATESPSHGGDPSLAPEAGSTCLVGLSTSSPDVAGAATAPKATAPSIAQYSVGPERLTWLSPSPTSPTPRSGTARHHPPCPPLSLGHYPGPGLALCQPPTPSCPLHNLQTRLLPQWS